MWMRNIKKKGEEEEVYTRYHLQSYAKIKAIHVNYSNESNVIAKSTALLTPSFLHISTSFSLNKLTRVCVCDDEISDKKKYSFNMQIGISIFPLPSLCCLSTLIIFAHSNTVGAMAFCYTVQFKISYSNHTKYAQLLSVLHYMYIVYLFVFLLYSRANHYLIVEKKVQTLLQWTECHKG